MARTGFSRFCSFGDAGLELGETLALHLLSFISAGVPSGKLRLLHRAILTGYFPIRRLECHSVHSFRHFFGRDLAITVMGPRPCMNSRAIRLVPALKLVIFSRVFFLNCDCSRTTPLNRCATIVNFLHPILRKTP